MRMDILILSAFPDSIDLACCCWVLLSCFAWPDLLRLAIPVGPGLARFGLPGDSQVLCLDQFGLPGRPEQADRSKQAEPQRPKQPDRAR